ncbi:MAG TPA: zf-HC2 domain-containing protein, partial [Gaiellaceae bacterium]|nr:zf-HC2 domain-containing protein [Gaiellaceae bacterium]
MSHRCERARAAISLQLDDGLSCVEQAFLERHLARCPSCSEFRVECRAFTGALRGADLERASTTLLFVRPRKQRRRAVQRAAV